MENEKMQVNFAPGVTEALNSTKKMSCRYWNLIKWN